MKIAGKPITLMIALAAGLIFTSASIAQQRFSGMRYNARNATGGVGVSRTFSGNGLSNYVDSTPGYGSRSTVSPNSYTRPNFGSNTPLRTRNNLQFRNPRLTGLTPGAGRGAGANLRSNLSTNLDSPVTAFLNTRDVILLPGRQEEFKSDIYTPTAPAAIERDIEPFPEEKFQRPQVKSGSVKKTYSQDNDNLATRKETFTTSKGEFYTSEQTARAREYIRREKYTLALDCYQTALAIDSRNFNSLIGTIYCHIMTGRFQAGGLGVLELARNVPEFWKRRPDFPAIFGMSQTQIVEKTLSMEKQNNDIFKKYSSDDGRKIAEDFKLVYLSKMFIGWLNDDLDRIKENISQASRSAPFDEQVQEIHLQITGQSHETPLPAIKPLD